MTLDHRISYDCNKLTLKFRRSTSLRRTESSNEQMNRVILAWLNT